MSLFTSFLVYHKYSKYPTPLQISLRFTGGLERKLYFTNVMKLHNSVLCLILIPQLFINDKQRTKKRKKKRRIGKPCILCLFLAYRSVNFQVVISKTASTINSKFILFVFVGVSNKIQCKAPYRKKKPLKFFQLCS